MQRVCEKDFSVKCYLSKLVTNVTLCGFEIKGMKSIDPLKDEGFPYKHVFTSVIFHFEIVSMVPHIIQTYERQDNNVLSR